MTTSTKVQWRVQVRRSRAHKWVNKGLFETRDAARLRAGEYRECFITERDTGKEYEPFGFGNTRVVRHEKGAK